MQRAVLSGYPQNKRIGKSQLSQYVQWLFELGGTGDVRELIIETFVKDRSLYPSTFHGSSKVVWWNDVNENPWCYNPSNTFWFTANASDGSPGHWVYYDTNGTEWNSYNLGHQKMGSHTFCQSFSLMYAISHLTCNKVTKMLVSQLQSGGSKKEYADNMLLVIQFWQYVLMQLSIKRQAKMVELIKTLNREYKDSRVVNRRGEYRENYVIAEDEDSITLDLISYRLESMKQNVEEMVDVL